MQKSVMIKLAVIGITFLFTTNGKTLNLDDCRNLALNNNPELSAERSRMYAAQKLKKASFTAFLPQIEGDAEYIRTGKKLSIEIPELKLPVQQFDPSTGTYEFDLLTDPSTGNPITTVDGEYIPNQIALVPNSTMEFGSLNNMSAGVELIQPVFTGGKIQNQYRIASLTTNIAQEQTRSGCTRIISNTDKRYWQTVTLHHKVKLAQQYSDMLDVHINSVKALQDEGILTKADMLKVMVKKSESELNLLRAQNGLKLARSALCQIINLPLDSAIDIDDTFRDTLIDGPQYDEAFLSAKNNRPELNQAGYSVSIADKMVKLAQSRYYPNIVAGTGYRWINPSPWDGLNDKLGGDWHISIGAQMELFHFNERGFEIGAAKDALNSANSDKTNIEELIALDVKQSLIHLSEASRRLVLVSRTLEQAAEHLRATNELFNEGMATSTDVLDAQTMWLSAATDRIEALAGLQIYHSQVQRAMGVLDRNVESQGGNS